MSSVEVGGAVMNCEIKLKIMSLYGKQEYIDIDYAELTMWSSEEIEAAYINKYADFHLPIG